MLREFLEKIIVFTHNYWLKVWVSQPGLFKSIPKFERSTIMGWGRKKSGIRATKIASYFNIDCLILEDGFLRSVGREDNALSVVFDDIGIFYDATAPSKLEILIKQELTEKQKNRTNQIIKDWRELRLSKYNSSSDYSAVLPEYYVLLIDQVFGDCSVEYGLATVASFEAMLVDACSRYPEATIIVKVHPDVYTRQKTGYFDIKALEKMPKVKVVAENCSPVRLIENAQAVYTVTSQVGFEALMWGKEVYCFGMPFYAGWGLTQDLLPPPNRRGAASLEQLVYAALVDYSQYALPGETESSQIEDVMKFICSYRCD